MLAVVFALPEGAAVVQREPAVFARSVPVVFARPEASAFAHFEVVAFARPEAAAAFARSEETASAHFEAAAAVQLAAVFERSNCPARLFAFAEPAADSDWPYCLGAKKAAGR